MDLHHHTSHKTTASDVKSWKIRAHGNYLLIQGGVIVQWNFNKYSSSKFVAVALGNRVYNEPIYKPIDSNYVGF